MSDERMAMIMFEVILHCLQCDEKVLVELQAPRAYGPGAYGVEDQIAGHKCPN